MEQQQKCRSIYCSQKTSTELRLGVGLFVKPMSSKTDVILWEPFSKQLASFPTNPDTGCVGLGDIQITTNKDRQIKIVESRFGSINAEGEEDDAERFFSKT